MIKNIFIFLVLLISYNTYAYDISTYIQNKYSSYSNLSFYDKPLYINDEKVYVFYHEIDLKTDLNRNRSEFISPKLIDFVVVCNYINESYFEYLRIEKENFYANENTQFIELSKTFQLDGWFIELFEDSNILKSFLTVPIFKNGTSITDGLNINYYKEFKSFGISSYFPVPRVRIDLNEPEIIQFARSDLSGFFEPSLIVEYLRKLDKRDLRIIRNALFAFYGYHFNSPDLMKYFSQFSWYSPNPTITNDLEILSESQKYMFNLVLQYENK